MGAWLGVRGLTYGGGRTRLTHSERRRAPPPTLYRAAASKRIASVSHIYVAVTGGGATFIVPYCIDFPPALPHLATLTDTSRPSNSLYVASDVSWAFWQFRCIML